MLLRARTLAIVTAGVLGAWALRAQEPGPPAGATGTIRGQVLDAEHDLRPILRARVSVLGTTLSSTTDLDGKFEIQGVPSGERTVQVEREKYTTVRQTVSLAPGAAVELKFELPIFRGEVVTVTGPLKATAVTKDILDRKENAGAVTQISKDEIDKKGGGNTVDAVKSLPSVTAVDGKFVYVRGLGDRYSQTLLNGSNLPSPEPDRRAVPLDLIPSALVQSIAVVKTYSPDTPGEFAGGSVQIRTIDVPIEPFLKLSFEGKYVDGTSFHDFETYHGGNFDWLSFDDGTRSIPEEVPNEPVKQGAPGSGLTAAQIQEIGRSFANIWNPSTITAPVNTKVGISFGQSFGGDATGRLGVVGAINWSNKYERIDDEKIQVVANAGTPQKPKPFAFSKFDLDTSYFKAELSGLLSFTYQINEGQKIGWRNLYTRLAEDSVREQAGIDGQRQDPVEVQRLRWVEQSLLSSQLFGEHLLVGDTFLEWRASYALSQRDEPDNRQVRYLYDPSINDYRFENISGSGRRDFYQLDENIYDTALDYSIPFNPLDVENKDPAADLKLKPVQRISLGGAFLYRDRDFDSRRLRFQSAGGGIPVDDNGNVVDLTASPEELFQKKNINPKGFVLSEETRPTDNYSATQSIVAGYGMADFRLLRELRLQAGVRVESSDQEVTTFSLFGLTNDAVKADLKTVDPLPAANLIWEFYEAPPPPPPDQPDSLLFEPPTVPGEMQLRLAASQTVSRPEFRELAPFEYTDIQGGRTARGNPDLERAEISNFDLAWEWYPSPGDLISLGGFYKHFDSPIEVVSLPTSSGLLTTWKNADKAELYGVEIEVRKKLGFFPQAAPWASDFSLLANFTWMTSEVTIAEDRNSQQTNNKRPLQGQPEYVLNLGLLYDHYDTETVPLARDSKETKVLRSGWSCALLANTFGKRISAVGSSGLDDEYEQPRWSLDLHMTRQFQNGSSLRLSAENLLNDKYEFKQNGLTTREYTRGFTIGLTYSLSF